MSGLEAGVPQGEPRSEQIAALDTLDTLGYPILGSPSLSLRMGWSCGLYQVMGCLPGAS